uniref:Carbonic anhydrase n=1 Tax=Syphacia muris TaxID=451379 RepID=A0A0N5AXA0_9BILA
MDVFSPLIIFSLLMLFLEVKSDSSHIGYTELDGPDKWNGTCRTGKRQSPVDIQASSIVWDSTLPRMHFVNYGVTSGRLFLTNDGHSILVNGFDKWGQDQPYVYGGPLSTEYFLTAFHFHWGLDAANGSEHTIGTLHYPGEIHFVHRKKGLTDNGILQSDSITVLGVFIALGDDPKGFQPLENAIQEVIDTPGKSTTLQSSSLMDLLPNNVATFYTYEGSLTTPGCNEVVTWVVFTDPISVTPEQMNLLRQTIITYDHKPGINYRPAQPLNGRKIRFRPATKVNSMASRTVCGFSLIAVLLSALAASTSAAF